MSLSLGRRSSRAASDCRAFANEHQAFGIFQARRERVGVLHMVGRSIRIVDDAGKIVLEVKVASDPEALLAVLKNLAYHFKRIGLEAGPLASSESEVGSSTE